MQPGKTLYNGIGIKILICILAIGLVVGFIAAYQKNQSKQAQLHFSQAEALYNNLKYQEAVKEYEFIAAKYPRTKHVPECWYKAGYIYRYFLSSDADAEKMLRKFINRSTATSYRKEALVLLVDIYARLRKYKEQNDIITRLLAKYPGAVDEDSLRLELAKGFYKLGQLKEAQEQIALIKNKESNLVKYSQEYYQLLSLQDPSNPQPHLELARIYQGMGLQERAAAELEAAKMIMKNSAEAKAVPQKGPAPVNYVRGPIQKKVSPKTAISPREEKLYIDYWTAQNKSWRAAMFEKSQSLGTPASEQQARAFGNKIQQYEKEWWSDWYAKNKTSYDECEEIRLKVVSDQGLARQLNEKIAK